jgi:Tol biopolymer transport system component
MLLFGAVLAAGLVAVAASIWLTRTRESPQASASPRPTPLTSDVGIERNPALSPDGRQIAYVSSGAGGLDLYVKLIGAGQPLQLTSTPALEMSPTWSPDARFVAFLRGTGEGRGFYIVPALGGLERKVADAFGSEIGAMPQAIDWSPDGKTLAVVDKRSADEPWSIFLVSVETGERLRLTQPPAGSNGDMLIAFSPDGSRLAFARTHDLMDDIYILPVPRGGAPTRVTWEKAKIGAVAWADQGASLAFTSQRGGTGNPSTLWKVPATGGLTPTPVAAVGEYVLDISVSRQGNRLAYAQFSFDTNIYSFDLVTATDKPHKAAAPVAFIPSTRVDGEPRFSPDGRRVAFTSNRSGSFELWVCDADGKNPAQLTAFGGPNVRAPSWSPDGRFIAFDLRGAGSSDVYVVGADGGNPRRLTMDPSGDSTPSWSNDGRWIYFASDRTGESEVWKMPAAGGAAVQLTRYGGLNPVESVDGRSVYYWRGRSEPAVWQVTLEGRDEAVVLQAAVDPDNWAAVASGIYFLNEERPGSLEFLDFATRGVRQIATLGETLRVSSMRVSSDQRRLLYVHRDRLEVDLMLVENFR